MDDVEQFSTPIGTGMRRVPDEDRQDFTAQAAEELRRKLAEFDAMRTRGAAEASVTPFRPVAPLPAAGPEETKP